MSINPKYNPDSIFDIFGGLKGYLNSMLMIRIMTSDGLDRVKRVIIWGTYGKMGNDPLKYVRLMDCSTEHLEAILRTQYQITPLYRECIESIIEDRNPFKAAA